MPRFPAPFVGEELRDLEAIFAVFGHLLEVGPQCLLLRAVEEMLSALEIIFLFHHLSIRPFPIMPIHELLPSALETAFFSFFLFVIILAFSLVGYGGALCLPSRVLETMVGSSCFISHTALSRLWRTCT